MNINPKDFFEEASENIKILQKRKYLLLEIAKKIAFVYNKDKHVNLNFICTHNSRRSQLGQVWGAYAAQYFNLHTIFSYSGGTEVTAFHKNTVKTLQAVGFIFDLLVFSHLNPTYLISYHKSKNAIIGFSKTFDDTHNKQPFIAITTCNNADKNCPYIPSAIHRFHLPYRDPKVSDKTEQSDRMYLETNQQIAAELFFIFFEVKKQIT